MKVVGLMLVAVLLCAGEVLAQVGDFAGTDFHKADSIAQLYPHYSLLDLKGLSEKLTHPLSTEQEKFRAIYKWICNNIDNDYTLARKNKNKRGKAQSRQELAGWNSAFSDEVFPILLKDQKTVCTGYAYLVMRLAAHAGLTSYIINGYGRTVESNIRGSGIANHSWNVIQLNHKWYLCDATWSSGSINTEMRQFVRKYEDCYFLPDPSSFIRNHYPLDSSWMLLDKKPTLHEFLNRPLIYSGAYAYKIHSLSPETFDITVAKSDSVSWLVETGKGRKIEKVELIVKEGYEENSFTPTLIQNSTGFYSFAHAFNFKGNYVVHILFDGRYVATHEVKVF